MFIFSHTVKTIVGEDCMRIFVANFKLRSAICLSTVLILMFLSFTRVIAVMADSKATSNAFNTIEIEIDSGRGNIYDKNGLRLTGGEEYFANVFLPSEKSIIKFAQETNGVEREKGLKTLRQNKPTVVFKKEKISGSGIYSFPTTKRYSDDLYLGQLIGYTNSENIGVYGLEKYFNEILYSDRSKTASFNVAASGDFLLGESPTVKNGNSKGNLFLTIDKNIQKICANSTAEMEKGGVVVSEISTGKILALLSKPGLSAEDLVSAINNKSQPFINRTLSAYSVGSVFKPVVAAAMLENNKGSFCYNCKGNTKILGIDFHCNNLNGHGKLNLKEAIAHSCNTYFFNGANTVSSTALHNIAVSLGFGSPIDLSGGVKASAGKLTTLDQLKKSKANIANFSIGQGNIALSPLVLCNLYSAIANNGEYYTPNLIEGYTNNKKFISNESSKKVVVFSKATAATLKEDLIYAIYTGTGKAAKPNYGGAGGKTATAQTGQYKNGKEILNSWFCGFFPADKPKYTVVVFCEDGVSGSKDAAPIFKNIADQMFLLGYK